MRALANKAPLGVDARSRGRAEAQALVDIGAGMTVGHGNVAIGTFALKVTGNVLAPAIEAEI